jgi:hypothetical protein
MSERVQPPVVGGPDKAGADVGFAEEKGVTFLRTDLFATDPGTAKHAHMAYRAFDFVKWLDLIESKGIKLVAICLERKPNGEIEPNITIIGDASRSDHFEEETNGSDA